MILIKPDKNRRIDIPGVAAHVPRPVDIDQAGTGFTHLRTLRIYRFEVDTVIEGHAEEDEVFIVMLSGSVELTMFEDPSVAKTPPSPTRPMELAAPSGEHQVVCAAYLPPRAAYQLIAKSDADVAYARATPSGTRPPKVFFSSAEAAAPGMSILLEGTDYAELLQVHLLQIEAGQEDLVFIPIPESKAMCEALVHVRTMPGGGVATISQAGAAPMLLDSWDTIAANPGDRPTVRIANGSSALVLLVLAVENPASLSRRP